MGFVKEDNLTNIMKLLKSPEHRQSLVNIKFRQHNRFGNTFLEIPDHKAREVFKALFGIRGEWIPRERLFALELLKNTTWIELPAATYSGTKGQRQRIKEKEKLYKRLGLPSDVISKKIDEEFNRNKKPVKFVEPSKTKS